MMPRFVVIGSSSPLDWDKLAGPGDSYVFVTAGKVQKGPPPPRHCLRKTRSSCSTGVPVTVPPHARGSRLC